MNDDLTNLWKALADPTRRHILDLLRQKPHTTSDLSNVFADEMSRYAVMKHLTVLEEANLIFIRRKGRERFNHLNVVPLQQMYERWLRPYEAHWASSLINLKNQVEGTNMSTETTTPSLAIHTIEQEIHIDASAEASFAALLDVNGWWGQRFARIPDSLRLEARVGGRFWETNDHSEENGTLWGIVTSIKPNDHIRIEGTIGMPGPILATVTLCTNPQENGTTTVTLAHQIMGDVPDRFLAGFTEGWADNLGSLKKLTESGERVALPGQPE